MYEALIESQARQFSGELKYHSVLRCPGNAMPVETDSRASIDFGGGDGRIRTGDLQVLPLHCDIIHVSVSSDFWTALEPVAMPL